MDAIDSRLLAELTADARTPLVTLAARVHLSRNAVKQRIERMEREGTIAGYTVIRGQSHEKPMSAMVLVYRADRMRGGDVIAALARIPEVVLCDVMSGEFDLVAMVQAPSIERLGQVWATIAALPGVENTVTSLSLTRVIERT